MHARGIGAEGREQIGDGVHLARPVDDDAERAFARVLREQDDGVIEFGLTQFGRGDQKLAGKRRGSHGIGRGRPRRVQYCRRQRQRYGEEEPALDARAHYVRPAASPRAAPRA
jgi:hypothetical protein